MKNLVEFLKTTVIGGLLVLFPLLGCTYLIIRIAGALTDFIKPFLSFIPESRIVGVALLDVVSVVVLLLLCFLTGLLVKTSVGSVFGQWMTQILNKIPGYRILGRITTIMFDEKDTSGSPVVVQRGQSKQIGFLVEEHNAEEFTVFFPSAPTPFSGSIEIVNAHDVEKLNVASAEVARVIATYGAGTRALLGDRQTKR